MSEDSKTVIIDVEVDGIDVEIGKIDTAIKKNREEIKELSKDYKANSTEIAANERVNKKLATQKRELIKDNQAEKGSLNDLRRQLVAQVKERNNLNKTTVEGSKRFAELQKSILGLNDEISGFEEAGGDFRRNVGNYPKLLGQAAGGIKVFGTSLNDVFNLIRANPLILLVTALVGLVKVFSETQAGAEFFRKTSAALNTILGLLKDIVEETGIALIEAFSNPKEALDSLVENIKNGVAFYLKEFLPNAIDKVIEGFGLLGKAANLLFKGEFSEALEVAKGGVTELVDGLIDLNPATAIIRAGFEAAIPAIKEFTEQVNTATVAAFGLEEQLIANEKALADQKVSLAQSIAGQKELNLLIEDQNAGFDDRIAAATEFARIEAEQIAESIRLQEERIEILKAQNDLTNSTEEDIQRVRDAEIELANLRAASLEREVTNQNKLNTVLNQRTALELASVKKVEDAKKKAAQEEIKLDKKVSSAKKQFQDTSLNAAIDVLGQGSDAGKAVASIQAGINVAEGITKALAAAPPPFNIGLAAVTAAAGAIQIAKINSTQAGAGAISSGGASAGSASISSGLSGVNASLLSQFSIAPDAASDNADNIGEAVSSAPPTEVSVVEITNAQTNLATKVTEATLG